MSEDTQATALLEVDVEQWRRDIRTFVDMTKQELTSIHNELASSFSQSSPNVSKRESTPNPPSQRETEQQDRENQAALAKTSTQEHLAQLKQKLASRVQDTSK